MGMYGVMITLSPKRLAQLEGDPETLEDVLEARHDTEIPGLLDLGRLDVVRRAQCQSRVDPGMAGQISDPPSSASKGRRWLLERRSWRVAGASLFARAMNFTAGPRARRHDRP